MNWYVAKQKRLGYIHIQVEGQKFSSGERKLLDFVTVSATSWIPVLTMYLFFIISSVIPEKLPFNFATVFWSIIVLSFKFFLTAVLLSTLLL